MIDGVVKELIASSGSSEAPPPITARQMEVLSQIVSGRSMKEIAFATGLSVKTIEKHRMQLMSRLGAKSTAELTMIAIRMGLVDPWKPTQAGALNSFPKAPPEVTEKALPAAPWGLHGLPILHPHP